MATTMMTALRPSSSAPHREPRQNARVIAMSSAPLGYRNNREIRRIEPDPVRGPLVTLLFERYAEGNVSLKGVTEYARKITLTHHRLSLQRLQQVQNMMDRAYDDRLTGKISDVMWARRSREWELELSGLRTDLERREAASSRYMVDRRRNPRTRERRENTVPPARTGRTGAFATNPTIELHPADRNSLSHLQKAVRRTGPGERN
jgi:hypothetical protein